MPKRQTLVDWGVAAATVAVFVFLVMRGACDTIVLTEDELAKGVAALRLLARLDGAHPEYWLSPSLIPHAIEYPLLMFKSYIGALPGHLAAIFILLFGSAAGPFFSLKLAAAASGAVVLVSVFAVVRRMAGRLEAHIVLFMLAFSNMFILASRFAFIREEVFQVAGFWLGLALISRAVAKGRRLGLYAAMFVFGLMFWAKIMFAGYALGVLCGFACLGRRGLRELVAMFAPSVSSALAAGAAFALGAMPFIVYNVKSGFPVMGVLGGAFSEGGQVMSDTGRVWNNADLPSNLAARASDLWAYLGGGLFLTRSFSLVFPVLFLASLAWALYYILTADGNDKRRPLLVVLCGGYALLFVLTCFVPCSHSREHVIVLVPFCELLCALFLARIVRGVGKGSGRAVVLVLLAAVWLAPQSAPWIRFGNAMDVRWGRAYVSRAEMGVLLDELERGGARNVVSSNCIGWALKFFDPSLNVFIVQDSFAAEEDKGFCERFREDDRQWWAVLSVFEFDSGFYEYLRGQGLFEEPFKVIAFRDRDDCAIALIRFDKEEKAA